MSRFRLFLAWLMLAALPLQGWAAASMLYCGPAQRAAVQAKEQVPVTASHHELHAGHHDMSAGQHAQHHMDDSATGDTGAAPDTSGHTCGVCAACCHGVALAQTQQWATALPPPAVHIAEPLVAVVARPSPVPDKPPRA